MKGPFRGSKAAEVPLITFLPRRSVASAAGQRVRIRHWEGRQLAAQAHVPATGPVLAAVVIRRHFCFFQNTIHSPSRDYGQLPQLPGTLKSTFTFWKFCSHANCSLRRQVWGGGVPGRGTPPMRTCEERMQGAQDRTGCAGKAGSVLEGLAQDPDPTHRGQRELSAFRASFSRGSKVRVRTTIVQGRMGSVP